jgi:hypothetical protein
MELLPPPRPRLLDAERQQDFQITSMKIMQMFFGRRARHRHDCLARATGPGLGSCIPLHHWNSTTSGSP